MPAPDPRLPRAIDAFASQRARFEDRAAAAVAAEFEDFDGWYAPSLVSEVTAAIAATVAREQKATAALTDAYLARTTSIIFARAVSGAGVADDMARTLRDGPADHVEVYSRVAAEFRRLRSIGADPVSALSAAQTRAREMVSTDLGLAHRLQVRRFNERNNVTRYRRIIRSEKTCGLCVAASDRLYRKSDLLPIHARCKCSVLAVTHATDPGSQLNNDTLEELYAEAGSTTAAGLKRVRVEVVEHGELGPQLRVLGQNFRGPSQVAA